MQLWQHAQRPRHRRPQLGPPWRGADHLSLDRQLVGCADTTEAAGHIVWRAAAAEDDPSGRLARDLYGNAPKGSIIKGAVTLHWPAAGFSAVHCRAEADEPRLSRASLARERKGYLTLEKLFYRQDPHRFWTPMLMAPLAYGDGGG